MLLERLKAYVQDPPPNLAVEISEAGLAGARLGAKTELGFVELKPGALVVSPVQENLIDPDEFSRAVRALAGVEAGRKRRDVALILPDYCARIAVLDFDSFPGDAKRTGVADPVPVEAERAVRRGIGGDELLAGAGRRRGRGWTCWWRWRRSR